MRIETPSFSLRGLLTLYEDENIIVHLHSHYNKKSSLHTLERKASWL